MTLIHFNCKCGQTINVPDVHAGKKGKCPGCKQIIVIPQAEAIQIPEIVEEPKLSFATADIKLSVPDILETRHSAPSAVDDARMFNRQPAQTAEDARPKRKLPWPIDIFLYPTSSAGITQLAIFLVVPFLIGILTLAAGPQLGIFIGIPGIVVMLVIYAFMAWYICECIRDSGNGGVRAPDVIASGPDLGDAFWQVLRIAVCYFLFLAPMIFYHAFTKRFDDIFWILGGVGTFFFPMGLLSISMHYSLAGLNPVLLIRSIVRVFFSYILLAVGLGTVIFLMIFAAKGLNAIGLRQIVIRCVGTYLMLVAAHLLGLFYYWKADKLNWEV